MNIKKILNTKEIVYPILFVLFNLIMLLIEYLRFGEFYTPLVGSSFAIIFSSGRYFLISALSIFLSSLIIIIVMLLKLVYVWTKRIFTKESRKEITASGNLASNIAVMMFIVFIAFYLANGYLKLTRGIGIWDQLWIFAIISINGALVFRFEDNLMVFSKAWFSFLGTVLLVCPLTIFITMGSNMFHNYMAAFGVLLLEIFVYTYVYTKMKPLIRKGSKEFYDSRNVSRRKTK